MDAQKISWITDEVQSTNVLGHMPAEAWGDVRMTLNDLAHKRAEEMGRRIVFLSWEGPVLTLLHEDAGKARHNDLLEEWGNAGSV